MPRSKTVLVAKVGLDGHDRGAKVVVRALREQGFDARFSGLHLTPEEVARAAAEQQVDLLGISIHSGAHAVLVPEVIRHLAGLGLDDLPVVVGGTVPEADRRALLAQGVRAVFTAGSSLCDIGRCVTDLCAKRRPFRNAV